MRSFKPTMHPYIEPWTEDFDLNHPGVDSEPTERFIIERHSHMLQHDKDHRFDYVAASAVFLPGAGEGVELGPWSMSEDDARCLAQSLLHLADQCADLRRNSVEVPFSEWPVDPDGPDGEVV